MHRPRPLPLAALIALVALAVGAPAAAASGDIDNDGRDDLVVGSPSEDVSQVSDAGQINILMGSGGGITAAGDVILDQADFGGTVEQTDRFGNAIAYGDFNNDGYDDIAVGAPAEDWNGAQDAGVVHVIYGSRSGPDTSDVQLLTQAGPMAGANESGDFFGAVLDSGDFDGDGYDDLVISVVGENFRNKVAAGAVVVAYGSRNGITTSGSKLFSQKGKVPGRTEFGDAFGFSLAVGDFDDDGFDDIAVGAVGEDIGSGEDAGAITILFGRSSGIRKGNALGFSQGGAVPGDNESSDEFGHALAAGDFDRDGVDDLAVGIPGEDGDTGSVVVFRGAADAGPTKANTYLIPATAIGGIGAGPGDQWGSTLAAGDFDDDGDDDLAIGGPHADVAGAAEAGRVVVLNGGGSGLNPGAAVVLDHQVLPGEAPEAGDGFGESLRVGDFDGDGADDLAIGVPFEARGGLLDSGIVNIVHGASGSGLSAGSAERWTQNTKGVRGSSESGDRFGEGL